jgi:hypothetical protein
MDGAEFVLVNVRSPVLIRAEKDTAMQRCYERCFYRGPSRAAYPASARHYM